MSIPAPGAIWRIIEAISRPIDQPIGPIHLDTADADWLYDHLLAIATKPEPREGAPPQSNHYIWVAVHVALERLKEPDKPRKVANYAVATYWRVKSDQVEEWERKVRDTAEQLLKKIDYTTLAQAVKRNRDIFLKKST